jgi:hypothetical protein
MYHVPPLVLRVGPDACVICIFPLGGRVVWFGAHIPFLVAGTALSASPPGHCRRHHGVPRRRPFAVPSCRRSCQHSCQHSNTLSTIAVSATSSCQHFRRVSIKGRGRPCRGTEKTNTQINKTIRVRAKQNNRQKKKEGHFAATISRPSMNSAVRTATVETKRLSACPGLLVGSLPKLRAGALLGRDSGSKTSQLKQ